MPTLTRKPRTIRPASADVIVERRLISPCTLIPAGLPARIVLNGKPYVVVVDDLGVTFHGSAGRSSTVNASTCTCEDWIYVREARGEPCKHVLACKKMQADGTI